MFNIVITYDRDTADEVAAEASDLDHAVRIALALADQLGIEDDQLLTAPRRVDIVSSGNVELSIRVTAGGLWGRPS